MFKYIVAASLILSSAAALPASAEEMGPGIGRISRSSNGYTAYVCTNNTSSSLTLRTGAGKDYNQIRQIPHGRNIQVLDSTGSRDGFRWFNVSYRGNSGWVRSDYVCTR
ncbi:SH3 domain-containing protein [Calothrix sp. PCC 6303]|uniref:SH3 domain-containing protein n=1 Tax=Calothrix sp. PCC 6303 TaxID=1170562 RepID=UPI0002A04130|nr:SH3 domain-containing protein [Calothrix sp. PCC 6303]AFZ00931.1 SH3 type 3 domain protein [Calothrix sp. PCC 6303]